MAKSRIIETRRLLIEPFSERHLTKRYVSWLNDPLVVRFSAQRKKRHALASCRKYLRSYKGTPHYFWAISTKGGGLGHIGNINAYIDSFNQLADIGILIGERLVWGQGYGCEAWSAVCNYLFKKVGIRKITAGTLSINSRMLSLMKKTGMVDDGRRIRHVLWEGKEVDVVYRAVFRK